MMLSLFICAISTKKGADFSAPFDCRERVPSFCPEPFAGNQTEVIRLFLHKLF